jgi:DNA-directed RNA polymerase subunit RPC12/RpoP
MQGEIKCSNCKVEIVVIEDKLFFSEEKVEVDIACPKCNVKIESKTTDCWFFVQTKFEYLKELEIEKKKERLIISKP